MSEHWWNSFKWVWDTQRSSGNTHGSVISLKRFRQTVIKVRGKNKLYCFKRIRRLSGSRWLCTLPTGEANANRIFVLNVFTFAPKKTSTTASVFQLKRTLKQNCVPVRGRSSVSLSRRHSSGDNEQLRRLDNGRWSRTCHESVNRIPAHFPLVDATKLQGCAEQPEKRLK